MAEVSEDRKPQAESQKRPAATAERESPPGAIALGKNCFILPNEPLPQFDLPGARAYKVIDQRANARQLLARVCDPGTLPRLAQIDFFSKLLDAHLMRPLEWEAVFWPPAGHRCFVASFERPPHGPLMASLDQAIQPLAPEDLSQHLIAPATLSLALLNRRSVTHRAIRPTNLYRNDADGQMVLLGDCVCGPPAAAQPVIVEPLESAMTAPLARGPGTTADDLFALGASVLLLAIGGSPLIGLGDRAIIEARLAKGSFAAMLGEARLPFSLRDVLRGLLSDNPESRWRIHDLEQWLSGNQRRAVFAGNEVEATRQFRFANGDHNSRRSLAYAFGENVDAALAELGRENVYRWMERSLGDPALSAQVESTVQDAHASGARRGAADATLVTRVSILMDPRGPLRYRGLSIMPDGLGPLLAEALRGGDNVTVRLIGEIISRGLAVNLLAARVPEDPMTRIYKRLQQLLRHAGAGYGIERCLYELNPQLPCLSPALAGDYVGSIRDLLPTLERLAESGKQMPVMVDRHIAAFIATSFKRSTDSMLTSLAGAEGDMVAAKRGMLGLLAALQYEFGPERLPHLTQWAAGELEAAAKQFFSRSTRDAVHKKFLQLAEGGSLVELDRALNNVKATRDDRAGRMLAVKAFSKLRLEAQKIEAKSEGVELQRTGMRVAANLSIGIGLAAVVTLFAM